MTLQSEPTQWYSAMFLLIRSQSEYQRESFLANVRQPPVATHSDAEP
jgi:hypothetical protein